ARRASRVRLRSASRSRLRVRSVRLHSRRSRHPTTTASTTISRSDWTNVMKNPACLRLPGIYCLRSSVVRPGGDDPTFGSGAEHAVAAIVLVIGRRALHAYGGLGGDDETAPPSADSLVFAGGLARDLAEAGYGLPVIECRGGAEQVLDHRHYQAHAVLHADLQQVGILQAQAAAVVLVVHQV